ncbi:MAG: Smr/MutS family protein [Caldimonas sp.]
MKANSLRELAALRAALAELRRAEEDKLLAEREQALQERRERSLFAAAVGQVVPLRKAAHAAPERPRPPARAHQRERDDAAVLVEAISDAFDGESLLETDDSLSFRRRGIGLDPVRKLRRGVWVRLGELDRHGLRRDEAREQLAAFLRESARSGARCVRIVHGKGHGSPGREPVLKAKVKSWLVQRNEVLAFTHARASEGGHGALIVLLKPGA